jgi:hypothetical protein
MADQESGWIYKSTVLFEDAKHQLVLEEYESNARVELCVEYNGEDESWCTQIPLPVDGNKAKAIVALFKAWSVQRKQHEGVEPAPNRFDSVEVGGLVEPADGQHNNQEV